MDAPEVTWMGPRSDLAMSEKDTLYKHGPGCGPSGEKALPTDAARVGGAAAADPAEAGDFVFDERVVRVFPDMIRRSVPGYALVLQMIGLLAHRYVQPGSQVYDLGCSLGAATLAMRQATTAPGVQFIGVDNSPAMIERCRERLQGEPGSPVNLVLGDICATEISDASMTVLNYTLQFLDPAQRPSLLQGIAAGTRPGGVLVLSEKICFDDATEQELQTALHHDFKRAQGYSEMEIARKRNALENVLVPDSDLRHRQRLRESGWRDPVCFFRSFNFASYLAFR